jgi:hypothetical protein
MDSEKDTKHRKSQYDRLIDLWKKHFQSEDEKQKHYYPIAPREPEEKECVLFVGINPSFNVSDMIDFSIDIYKQDKEDDHALNLKCDGCDKKDHKKTENCNEVLRLNSIYKYSNDIFDQIKDVEIQKLAKEKYNYYIKFHDFTIDTGLNWDAVDLFFYRMTNQSDFKEKFFEENGEQVDTVEKYKNFIDCQLKISQEIIENAEPKCLIICNAFASKLYIQKYNLKFDEEFGCYSQLIGGKSIPVFTSGMLSGQRALDLHSLKRLKWHVLNVLGVSKFPEKDFYLSQNAKKELDT